MATDRTQSGHNLTALKDEIKKGVDAILSAADVRAEANADLEAIRANLESKGIKRKALAMAISYSKMDEDQRRGFDTAYELVREAIGLPLQRDLFELVPPTKKEKKGKTDGEATDDGESNEVH